MKESVSDALGVPGHVVMIRRMTKQEAIAEIRASLDRWEAQGWTHLRDVPEGPEKEQFYKLAQELKLPEALEKVRK